MTLRPLTSASRDSADSYAAPRLPITTSKNDDGTTGKLKQENWPDYAQYLEDYVQYLRENGVELDAISIQNEPDWPAQYAGCLWDPTEIADFVKTNDRSINCKIIALETLAISDKMKKVQMK